jgi:aspartyl/asparaginyl-tRNA synthetase
LRGEDVIQITGKVAPRLTGTENAKLATGEIEVIASELTVLNKSDVPPFPLDSKLANEDAACERSRLQAVTETQLAAAPHVELDEALASADLHLHFKEQALTTLRAAAPIEPMIRQTRKMEAGELAVRRHLAAYPSPRSVPAQAGAIGPHRA